MRSFALYGVFSFPYGIIKAHPEIAPESQTVKVNTFRGLFKVIFNGFSDWTFLVWCDIHVHTFLIKPVLINVPNISIKQIKL